MSILAFIPILLLLQTPYFDMQGTINDVLTPGSLVVDNKVVYLADIDTSGLNATQYAYLVYDLKSWLIGKDVFIKDGYVYFDLNGSYNSVSINEMIQKEIQNLEENFADYVDQRSSRTYSMGSFVSFTVT